MRPRRRRSTESYEDERDSLLHEIKAMEKRLSQDDEEEELEAQEEEEEEITAQDEELEEEEDEIELGQDEEEEIKAQDEEFEEEEEIEVGQDEDLVSQIEELSQELEEVEDEEEAEDIISSARNRAAKRRKTRSSEKSPGVEDQITQDYLDEVEEAAGSKVKTVEPKNAFVARVKVATQRLDRVADYLEKKGDKRLALRIDRLSDALDKSIGLRK